MEIQSRFISNSETTPIIQHVAELFEQSNQVDCAIAFLSFGGWQLMQPILEKWFASKQQRFRLVVRKDQKFPDMRAVEALNHFEGVELRIVPSINFHAKQWIFYATDTVYVLTGSANMTRSGLMTNAEANVITQMSYNHPELIKIETMFQHWWEQGTITPKIQYWKGVEILMTVEGMRFNLKDLTLDEIVWLRDHYNKYSQHFEPSVNLSKSGAIADIQFTVSVNFKTWDPTVMNCLNEILQKFKPTA